MLDGNLRKQESALSVIDNQEFMTPDFNCLGLDQFERREQRNLNAHLSELALLQRTKARILEGRADGASDDSFSQRFARLGYSNASLQMSAHMKGYKDTASFREDSLSWNQVRKFAMSNRFDNRLAGQLQRSALLCFREARHPETSCGLQASSVCAA